MFSSRTKLGLRLLNELGKDTDVKMTATDLKRRIGVSVGMREAEWVLQDLKNAALVESDWKSNRRRYFHAPDAGKASLYDLINAVDGRFNLWAEYSGYLPYNFTRELSRVVDAETRVGHEVNSMLKSIFLSELICVQQRETKGMPEKTAIEVMGN